mgnify:FL=1
MNRLSVMAQLSPELTRTRSGNVIIATVAGVSNNPYEVLGVSRTATDEDIRSAYRRLAMQHHPDRNPADAAAEERFKSVSEAYATLRDPDARARVDRYGSSAPRPDFNTVDWQTVFREADVQVDWDRHQGMPRTGSGVFDVLFGMMTGMMRRSGLLPGEHREVSIQIPLSLARSGGTTHVHVRGPSVCPECFGSGVSSAERCGRCTGSGVLRAGSVVEVSIRPGVRQGSRLRLRGVGGPGRPPGDVLVSVAIQLPANTTISGGDIHTDVFVAPFEAQRGVSANVLGTTVRIPQGTKDSSQIRVPGAGLGGDMVVLIRHDLVRGVWRGIRDLFSGSRGAAHG